MTNSTTRLPPRSGGASSTLVTQAHMTAYQARPRPSMIRHTRLAFCEYEKSDGEPAQHGLALWSS